MASASMRATTGSWMPGGRSTRTLETASRTSATARSIGVPMANSMNTRDCPSIASEVMLSMLPMLATAASTFCMIWVSISCGDAPGWETSTCTPGKEMSGLSVRGRRKKATSPMKTRTTNSTTGVTGWRIAHADMFFMACLYLAALAGAGAMRTSSPSRRKPPAVATTRSLPVSPELMMVPASVIPETLTGWRSTLLAELTIST